MNGRLFAFGLVSLLAGQCNLASAQENAAYPAGFLQNGLEPAWVDFAQPGYSDISPVAFAQAQAGAQPAPQPGQPMGQPNPGLVQPAPAPAGPFANAQRPANRQQYLSRLQRAPDIFGDSFVPQTVVLDFSHFSDVGGSSLDNGNRVLEADVPIGGGSRRFKNEQARALPTDRVFFLYNHFHNALEVRSTTGGTTRNVNQYTLGVERTFGQDQEWSVELRMPFSGSTDLNAPGFNFQSDGIGNFTAVLKRLMYADESTAFALGMAVTTPTGSDADIVVGSAQNVRIQVENEAVHLLPYAALQFAPDENWFFNAYAQVDVAANGNGVTITGPALTASDHVSEQTLLYLDAAAGYWWYRSDNEDGLTGLASVLELHYTGSLGNPPVNNIDRNGFLYYGSGQKRVDVVNMTAGINSEWWHHTSLRTAVVVPLGGESNRFFDGEVQVALIRRF